MNVIAERMRITNSVEGADTLRAGYVITVLRADFLNDEVAYRFSDDTSLHHCRLSALMKSSEPRARGSYGNQR